MQPEGSSLAVKGPKGHLRIPLPQGISVEKQDGHLAEARRMTSKRLCTAWSAACWRTPFMA